MDFEEYEFNKRELLSQIDRPSVFHNPELAADFFEQLKSEIPEAAFFVKAESPREVGAQYIIDMASSNEVRVSSTTTAKGRMPNVRAGKMRFDKVRYSPRPYSSTVYRLPVMLKPVTSSKMKPKIHAIRMAAKNEGNDMPMVVMNKVSLFKKFVLKTAVRIPMAKPRMKAMEMDTTARSNVLGKASPRILETLRLLWYDILR